MFTKDKAFYKSFVTLSLALMAEQAVILSVNLADNVMLGSYSESALSGVAAVTRSSLCSSSWCTVSATA